MLDFGSAVSNIGISIERMLSPYDSKYRKRNKLSYHSERVQEMFMRREKMRNIQQQRLEEFQEKQDNKDRIRQPVIYKNGDWVIRREKVIGSRARGTAIYMSPEMLDILGNPKN